MRKPWWRISAKSGLFKMKGYVEVGITKDGDSELLNCEGEVSTSPFIAPTRKTMWGEGGDFKMGPGHQEKIVTFDFGSLDKFPPGEFRIICPNLVTPFKPYK